jgi:hypothetical protein
MINQRKTYKNNGKDMIKLNKKEYEINSGFKLIFQT